jgi:scyllo-inositol 2-dehydrogenase (NADP+)
MFRAGVIGLGKMGISHLAILNAHEEVDVVGICDAAKFMLGALAKNTGVAGFSDYRKMIDQARPDFVVVATPTASHADIARYAMQRDVHVFVEKPFCLGPDEGRQLVQLAESHGLANQVGYVNRFNAVFTEARRLVAAGAIGEVYHFLAEMYGPVVVKDQGSSWRGKRSAGGGCLYEYGSHCIDLVNYLVDRPVERVSSASLTRIHSQNVEDAVFATFLYDGPLTGQLAVNWSDESCRKATNRVSLWGRGGKITVSKQECRVYLREGYEQDGFSPGWNVRYNTDLAQPVSFFLRGEEYSAQLDHFVECLKDPARDNRSSFASALETDVLIRRIVESADGGSK